MKVFTQLSIALVTTATLAGGAYAADSVKKAVQDAKTGVFDLFNKNSATIDFEAGQSTVSAGEKSDIKAVVDAVKSDAKIEKVIVAAWSDEEYPTTKDTKLSKAAQDLAELRGKAVKAALEADGVKHVEVFSMAEYPSWMSRTFNTEDAKIKGLGKTKSTKDAVLEEVGREMRQAGGPGKAVVFVLHHGESLSH